jgi:hypothetical protein
MKKIVLVLSLALLSLSFQANAATLSWASTPVAATTAGSTSDQLVGSYGNFIPKGTILNDNWKFNLADTSVASIELNVLEFINSTFNILVTLDGNLLTFTNGLWTFADILSAGDHTINISGKVVRKNGNLNLSVGTIPQVPVPAALWLFGSAVLGLLGLSSRKKSTSANPVQA